MGAQPQLQREIDALVDDLVQQLSRRPYIKSIAILDLTRTDYSPSELGRTLRQELYTSIVKHPDRKFRVINRQRLEQLLAEADLDNDGFLSPENTPRLGHLTAINLVIGGTLTPNANQARINLEGIELETQSVEAAANGTISLTESLRMLDPEVVTEKVTTVREGTIPEPPVSWAPEPSLSMKQLTFAPEGCRTEGVRTYCTYSITSREMDTNLTVYANRATSQGQSIQITGVQLGQAKGRGSATNTLYGGKAELLTFSFPVGRHPLGQKIKVAFFSDRNGRFEFSLPLNN